MHTGFVYYVDRGYKRIERASLYNNTKTHVSGTTFKHGQNTHPYSGETIHYVTPFTSVQTTTPYGLALDLRWNSRYLYFTVPGVAGTADGTVKRCALDVAGGIWNLCTEEDLSTVIEAALGSQINTPRGIALDLVHLKVRPSTRMRTHTHAAFALFTPLFTPLFIHVYGEAVLGG